MRSIGGPTCLEDGVAIQTSMQRMRAFVKVAIHVTVAEFPNYEVVSAFRIFCMDEKKKGWKDTSDPEVATCFERLAQFYGVDKTQLQVEFVDLAQVAKSRMTLNGCSARDAWQYAATRAMEKRSTKTPCRYSMNALGRVLQHYLAISISTAGVEQDFSKFKRVFGEQALGALDDTEGMNAKVVLDRSHVEVKDDLTIKRAQEIYSESFNKPRKRYASRIDKGVLRGGTDSKKARTGGSEAAWQRQRRMSVNSAVAGSAKDFKLDADTVAVDESIWQDSHKKMVEKQLAIDRRNKAEAFQDGALIRSEIDQQTKNDSDKMIQRRMKNDRERGNKQKDWKMLTSKKKLDLTTLANVHWYMDDGAKEQVTLEQACRVLPHSLMETDPLKATLFLTKDTGIDIYVAQVLIMPPTRRYFITKRGGGVRGSRGRSLRRCLACQGSCTCHIQGDLDCCVGRRTRRLSTDRFEQWCRRHAGIQGGLGYKEEGLRH